MDFFVFCFLSIFLSLSRVIYYEDMSAVVIVMTSADPDAIKDFAFVHLSEISPSELHFSHFFMKFRPKDGRS
jgi:hypothetical protein